MHNYEIMLIVESTTNESLIHSLVDPIFKSNKKLEKLERTQLAYPIKKQKTAQYFVLNVEANAEEIKEFSRKASLSKEVLRNLVINLDTEKALQRKPKQSKFKKSKFASRPIQVEKKFEAKKPEIYNEEKPRTKKEVKKVEN